MASPATPPTAPDALQDQLTRERRIIGMLVGLLGTAVLRSLIAG